MFSGENRAGEFFVWLAGDTLLRGSGATPDRDGTDYYWETVGKQTLWEQADVESTEAWYPVRYHHRRRDVRFAHGAQRGGIGGQAAWEPIGSTSLFGTSVGQHDLLPCDGSAGGLEGPRTRIAVGHHDGTETELKHTAQQFEVKPGEEFRSWGGSGAAWGDPLDRSVELVEEDVRQGLLTEAEAREIYGVAVGDLETTMSTRTQIGAERLRRASLPTDEPVALDASLDLDVPGLPIAPGVEQRGMFAVAIGTGAVLAKAPQHWTAGCPVILESAGDSVERRGYLDPKSGRLLHSEVVPMGEPRTFASLPDRWVTAGM
jgi:N-methylhydantoinase B